jgi:putative transcriptional regulator
MKRSVYYFGLNVRRKRQSLKLNQTECAKYIGCSRNQLSNYEVGNYLPSAEMILKFADFFGCPIDELFEEV